MDEKIVYLLLLSAGISLFISFGRWLSSKKSDDLFDHAGKLTEAGKARLDESLAGAFEVAQAAPADENLNAGDAVLNVCELLEDPQTQVSDDGRLIFNKGNVYQVAFDGKRPPVYLRKNKYMYFDDTDNGPSLRGIKVEHRVPCQFCGQPGERMTVCRYCGGRVA